MNRFSHTSKVSLHYSLSLCGHPNAHIRGQDVFYFDSPIVVGKSLEASFSWCLFNREPLGWLRLDRSADAVILSPENLYDHLYACYNRDFHAPFPR